jgi:hypothetical protein
MEFAKAAPPDSTPARAGSQGDLQTADSQSLASDREKQRQAQAQELVQAATEFRLYSLLALAKLKLWIILRLDEWPLLPSPSLPGLRHLFDIDAVSSYHRLREAAGSLSLAYGYDYHQELSQRL